MQDLKIAKNSPSAHHLTNLSGCIFTTKARIDNRKKKHVKQQCLLHMPHNMTNVGPVTAEIGLPVWAPHSTFQRVPRLGFVTEPTSVTGGQPNFARCLAISWAATLYMHFRGALTSKSCVLLYWQRYTALAAVRQTLWRGTGNGITELSQRAPPIFGWAAITLGIGPHSS